MCGDNNIKEIEKNTDRADLRESERNTLKEQTLKRLKGTL